MGIVFQSQQGNSYQHGNVFLDSVATENMIGPVENLSVPDSSLVSCLRLLTTGIVAIGGMTNGVHSRQLLLTNEGQFAITIVANSVNSSPNNRFASSATIAVGQTLWCMYSAVANAWLIAAGGNGGGGGGTPAGPNTAVQFNNAGAFAGDAGLLFDSATTTLTLGKIGAPGVIQSPADFDVKANAIALSVNAGTNSALQLLSSGDWEVGPAANPGTSGQALLSAGPGAPPDWGNVSATPASPANSIQFNNAGAFGGSADFLFDPATNTLTFGNGVTQPVIDTQTGMLTIIVSPISSFIIDFLRARYASTLDFNIEVGCQCFGGGTSSVAGIAIECNGSAKFRRSDPNYAGSLLVNGPAGQSTVIDCDAGPFSIGIANVEATRIDANLNYSIRAGFAESAVDYNVPTTGFTYTMPNNIAASVFIPAGALLAGTIILPATPIDGQIVEFSTTQTITTLTVNANAGQSISNAPTTLSIGAGFSFRYRQSNTTWYRRF